MLQLRKKPDFQHEIQAGFPRLTVVGVDEVGRGCLAGPVVAAAALLPVSVLKSPPSWLSEVTDSKLLTPQKREFLSGLLKEWVLDYSIAQASVEEIDQINIYHASHLAMVRAVQGLRKSDAQFVLVDGNRIPSGFAVPAKAVIKGDLKVLSIACASILAKVERDRWMQDFEAQYPGYGFGVHKGYSTPQHKKALRSLGATVIHRRSFSPVAQVLQGQ